MFVTDAILADDDIAHGFFGRRGGVSAGMYDSLNCGMGTQDDPAAVLENRRRVTEKLSLPPDRLITMNQTHSADCVLVTQAPSHRVRADALVTDQPDLALGVLTADCAPVLFGGRDKAGRPVIGAAHAGWRGALDGVLGNTVAAMRKLGAENISAAIGPCIAQASYEVSAAFLKPFLEQDKDNIAFFTAGKSESARQFDLPGYVLKRLRQAGVDRVSGGGIDTYAQEAEYFSYRRTTHRTEPDYGRQIAIIAIRP